MAEAPLSGYNAKRDFKLTSEPAGLPAKRSPKSKALCFVIQKHWASRLHYDFRLELDGVMLSWAVPKGPTYDPAIKQLAIHVEDHPISYNAFEGTIPKGQYGAGTVIIWDRGTWEPVDDPRDGMAKGKLIFKLHGQKLAGLWELGRISKPGEVKQEQWLPAQEARRRLGAADFGVRRHPGAARQRVEKPLGPVEEREPRAAAVAPRAPAPDTTTDMQQAVEAPLPAKLAP